jgi:hypothetical protein
MQKGSLYNSYFVAIKLGQAGTPTLWVWDVVNAIVQNATFSLSCFWGKITTSVNEKKSSRNNTVVTSITNKPRDPGEAGADENKKFTQIRTLETKYEIVEGEKAIDSASYANYYLPEDFQKEIQRRMDSNLDLSDGRFDEGKEKPKSRKRNK